MVERLDNRGAGLRRQEIAADLVHPLAELGNLLKAFPRDDAEFRQESPHCVDRGSALADEQRANTMQRQYALLIERLDRDKPHVRPDDGFADRLSIGCIGLVPLHVWLDVLRWDQPHGMAETGEFARPVVRSGARLHPDQTSRQLSKIRHQLVSREPPAQHSPAGIINAMDLKY